MQARWLLVCICTFAVLPALAFQLGRHRGTEKAKLSRQVSMPPAPAGPQMNDQLRQPLTVPFNIQSIAELSFVDACRAIRFASPAQREVWANEIAAMPEGPRRYAALACFYRTLVQFDAAAAARLVMTLPLGTFDLSRRTEAMAGLVPSVSMGLYPGFG